MHLDKPVIKELNYSKEQINEVKRIMTSPKEFKTNKRDKIRAVLNGPSCCSCNDIPLIEVRYQVGDKETPLTRVETYCDKCFETVYEKTKDTGIDQIAEAYGCVKAEPN